MGLTRLGKPPPGFPTGPTKAGVSMTGTGGESKTGISAGTITTAAGWTGTCSAKTMSWTSV